MNEIIITKEESGERIDALLSRYTASRSAAVRLLEQGQVSCSGRSVKKNYRVCEGDRICYHSNDLMRFFQMRGQMMGG